MKIESIKSKLKSRAIFYSEDQLFGKPTVVGYDKQFRWSWMATQLNTFVIVTDFLDEPVTDSLVEQHLAESFKYAKKHYNGWPRGLQSGIGVISILVSTQVDEKAKEYCRQLKSGKKWAGFTIPVAIHAPSNEVYFFQSSPMWGRIYYPYFKKLIKEIS